MNWAAFKQLSLTWVGKVKAAYFAIPIQLRDFILACATIVWLYALWLYFSTPAPKPGQVVPGKSAPAIAAMPKREVHPKRVVVLKDKKKAVIALGLPAEEASDDQEELADAIVTPPSKYGDTVAIFLNTSTGKVRTAVKVNEAPWFRFERGNEVGVEVQQSPKGPRYQVDYTRDVMSVKGATLSVKPGIRYEVDTQKVDTFIGARLKYSW